MGLPASLLKSRALSEGDDFCGQSTGLAAQARIWAIAHGVPDQLLLGGVELQHAQDISDWQTVSHSVVNQLAREAMSVESMLGWLPRPASGPLPMGSQISCCSVALSCSARSDSVGSRIKSQSVACDPSCQGGDVCGQCAGLAAQACIWPIAHGVPDQLLLSGIELQHARSVSKQ